jgi:TRAP transporter TAXI family solute receptor
LFSIGSGDISGNYYPVAKAICDVFNESDDTRRRCSPEPSAGSVYNLIALRDREIEFAIVQSDWLRAAYNGTEVFKGSPPMKDLRIVMPLFPETITVLVGPGKEIRTALDLAGAVVDIGRPASGRNATIQSLLSKLGVGNDFFGNVKELKPSVSISQLCEGRIDAAIFVLGHPSELVRNALRKCRATIIEFAGPRVNTLLAESEDYQRSSINQKLYDVRMEATSSISVMATLVTRSDLENAIVQDLVDAVKMNSAELTEQQPVLQSFSQTIAENAGLGVPKHPVMRGSQ